VLFNIIRHKVSSYQQILNRKTLHWYSLHRRVVWWRSSQSSTTEQWHVYTTLVADTGTCLGTYSRLRDASKRVFVACHPLASSVKIQLSSSESLSSADRNATDYTTEDIIRDTQPALCCWIRHPGTLGALMHCTVVSTRSSATA